MEEKLGRSWLTGCGPLCCFLPVRKASHDDQVAEVEWPGDADSRAAQPADGCSAATPATISWEAAASRASR
jgi:hypothetical protein